MYIMQSTQYLLKYKATWVESPSFYIHIQGGLIKYIVYH